MEKRPISGREKADIRVLVKFVEVYCRENHDGRKNVFAFRKLDLEEIEKREFLLCQDCTKLLAYGLTMRLKCPHDPKPMCKKCETQCYHRNYRSKIREVMKFSGLYLIKHGRVDMLYHYFR